ncbi:MAG: glucose-6-phosphate isomerase [Tissierellia bacterium]|nr:glucose-6-phosphate isomerase [Tissierellia bacterium]
MDNIGFDYSNSFIEHHQIEYMQPFIEMAHSLLHDGKDSRGDFIGWMDLPEDPDKHELAMIEKAASRIRHDSDALIVIGIGGSYMGSRACIEALNHSFYNHLPIDRNRGPRIYYAGNNMSSSYMADLMDMLDGLNISINVISKSGTTIEPAVAFRLLKGYMEDRYGREESRHRIYITTDRDSGSLRALADGEGYASFVIPRDIGGRYSVLTAVGLLPMAVSGIDIGELLAGARHGMEEYSRTQVDDNICYQYAMARQILYGRGKEIELFINYEPRLNNLGEWWKQLFGESDGKDGRGIYPSPINFTTDLHSMGQLIQDGRKNLFETTLYIERPNHDIGIRMDESNLDGLNYLADRTVDFVNKKAFEGTLMAHTRDGVPNLVIRLPRIGEYYIGKLIYFFQKACAIGGYLSGINPFNQPGVEEYKRYMFSFLGRPKG